MYTTNFLKTFLQLMVFQFSPYFKGIDREIKLLEIDGVKYKATIFDTAG